MAGIGDIGRLVATIGLNTSPFMAGIKQSESAMARLSAGAMMLGRTMTRFVTLPMVLAGGAAVATQKNFEASMTKIIGLVGVAREQVEKWNGAVLKMAATTGRGPEELADALYFITSAGIRGAEAMEVLEMSAKAAAIGLGETKVVADLVTSAMNAYGRENLSAAQAVDILVASVREGKAEANELAGAMGMVLPIASEFGVTFDQVGAAFAGMTRTGTNARVAATQLKAILSAMASPSMQAADAMATYGTNAETFRKTVREQGLIRALLDLREATEGQEDAMGNIFPNIRALMGTLDLLGKNVNYNVAIFEALANASGSLARAFEEVGGTTQQKLNVALATLKATLVSVGEVLKPFVTKLLTFLNDRLAVTSKRFENVTEAQRKTTVTLTLLTAAAGPFLLIFSRITQIIRANKWLALAVAVGTVALAVSKWLAVQITANKVGRQAVKQREYIEESMIKESMIIKHLFTDLKSATKGTEEWEAIRSKINSKYGQYLDNIITEKDTYVELEEALTKVTKARIADLKVTAYGEELLRLEQTYIDGYIQAMDRFLKFVSSNRIELKGVHGKTVTEFRNALDESIAADVETIGTAASDGAVFTALDAELLKNARKVYDTFIGVFESQEYLGILTKELKEISWETFIPRYVNAVMLKKEFLKQKDIIQGLMDSFKDSVLGDDEVAAERIKELDVQIAYTKDVADSLGKQVALETLIALHKEKSKVLTGDLKADNEAILADLQKQLKIYNKIQSNLGIEAELTAAIDLLQNKRKILTKDQLTDNSKALAVARQKLAVLQLETSGLNKIEMLRGRIKIAQDEGRYLKDKELAKNKEGIRDMEREVDIRELVADGVGTIGILQAELNQLKEDSVRMSDAEVRAQARLIQEKEKELRFEKASLLHMGDREWYLFRIRELNEDIKGKSGDEWIRLRAQIDLYRQRVAEIDATAGGLGDIEVVDLRIKEIEQQIQDGTIEQKRELTKILRIWENLRGIIEDVGDDDGEPLAPPGSGAWYKHYQDRINELKAFHREVGQLSNANAAELDRLQKTLTEQRISDMIKVLSAAQDVSNAMQSLFRARMDAEMKLVGKNKKKQEAIEKAYYIKMRRWAIAAAIIYTAIGVARELKDKGVAGIVTGILVAAKGAIEVAAIQAQSFAKGGIVGGTSKTGDKIPIMVNSGELILTAKQQKNLQHILEWVTDISFFEQLFPGAALGSLADQIELKAGGLVFGDTVARLGEYPGVVSNPEVVAPIKTLKKYLSPKSNEIPKTIKLVLEGGDAVAMIDTELLNRNTY